MRGLVKQHNIPIHEITGTGKDGRVTKSDAILYISNKGNTAKIANLELTQSVSSSSNTQVQKGPVSSSTVVKMSGVQLGMSKKMTEALQIPQLLYTDEFQIDRLAALRQEINSDGKLKITMTSLFLKLISTALTDYPILNSIARSSPDKVLDSYEILADHNITVAIDSSRGLMVPNIKSVQTKGIFQIQKELNDLRTKVENNQITNNDLSDGSISVSNIGNIGGKVVGPIILPPQVCIIGIGRAFDLIKMVEAKDAKTNFIPFASGQMGVEVRKAVPICISADHRIVDGSTVARFGERLRQLIDNPIRAFI